MLEQIQAWTSHVLETQMSTPLFILAVLALGFTAAIGSCCNVGIIGAVASYSGSQIAGLRTNTLVSTALFFTIGNIIALSIIGALTGFVSQAVGAMVGSYWKIIGGLVAVYFGLAAIGFLPFDIPQPSFLKEKVNTKNVNGLVFGLALGGFATACSASCNPIFAVVLGMSFLQGSILWSWLILFVFAIGYSIPLGGMLVGLGFGFNKIAHVFLKYAEAIKLVSGGFLILIGFALLMGVL